MQKEPIPKFLRIVYAVSMVVSPSSFICLRLLNQKDFLPWMDARYIPWFGFPLAIIFFASTLFGGRALITFINNGYERYKQLLEIERRYRKDDEE